MNILGNAFNNALSWATGQKAEVPQSRLEAMGSDFVGWITASQPATTNQADGFKAIFSRNTPAEAPEGIKRAFIVAMRAGITVAAATAITAAAAGALSVSGIAMGYFGAAIEGLSIESTGFVATCCGSAGYGLQYLGEMSEIAGSVLFAGIQDFAYTGCVTLPIYLYENLLPLVQEALSWINANVLQPGFEMGGDLLQYGWNQLPTSEAALAATKGFFEGCGNSLAGLAERIGLISPAGL